IVRAWNGSFRCARMCSSPPGSAGFRLLTLERSGGDFLQPPGAQAFQASGTAENTPRKARNTRNDHFVVVSPSFLEFRVFRFLQLRVFRGPGSAAGWSGLTPGESAVSRAEAPAIGRRDGGG